MSSNPKKVEKAEKKNKDRKKGAEAKEKKENLTASAFEKEFKLSASPQLLTGIATPGNDDVIFGKGGGSNEHPGNKSFREDTVARFKDYYALLAEAQKKIKTEIANRVVQEVKGKFLKKWDGIHGDHLWYEVGYKVARDKASQCLREKREEVKAKLLKGTEGKLLCDIQKEHRLKLLCSHSAPRTPVTSPSWRVDANPQKPYANGGVNPNPPSNPAPTNAPLLPYLSDLPLDMTKSFEGWCNDGSETPLPTDNDDSEVRLPAVNDGFETPSPTSLKRGRSKGSEMWGEQYRRAPSPFGFDDSYEDRDNSFDKDPIPCKRDTIGFEEWALVAKQEKEMEIDEYIELLFDPDLDWCVVEDNDGQLILDDMTNDINEYNHNPIN